ncbi:MAG: N-acetylmuramoyl-L-alanine amidase [Hyphomicrobiaceae bacterium]|nr:N-acetylmuramoyl-L-alanine amidase [Hyphomicrobiaceae bacterium]
MVQPISRPDSPLVDAVEPSPNIEARRRGLSPSILLLHYTGLESMAKAIDWLTREGSGVSCHYGIDMDGRITQMVAEENRAWHAGESVWAGETDINSVSIGVEIHNPGHQLGYPDFPEAQMQAVELLSRDIVARHGIRPERVLAHSDVAPARKKDPGEKFHWARLARAGIGHWVVPVPVSAAAPGSSLGVAGPQVATLQRALLRYGYGIEPTGVVDARTEAVVTAFQRHFRPQRVDGRIDDSTIATLDRLLTALPSYVT